MNQAAAHARPADERPSRPRLSLERATCRFGATVAVDALDRTLAPGQLHALGGENGAGKSTALKLLAGVVAPTTGSVLVGDVLLAPEPRAAISHGIGLVHQHFMLVEAFTALENVMLGCEPTSRGLLDRAAARARALRVAQDAGLTLALDRRVSELSVGEKQRLEIARVLFRGARTLLLDEPTAVLAPVEAAELYATLRRLADGGAAVLVVTHRLGEVVRYADEVTVMRHGRKVHHEALGASLRGGLEAERLDERLTRAVMGEEPAVLRTPEAVPEGAERVLELAGLAIRRSTGGDGVAGMARAANTRAVRDLSLAVRAGEIVGVAGIEGNGQSELVQALAGLLPLDAGTIRLRRETLFTPEIKGDPAARVQSARSLGLVVVHDDRHRDELVLDATVADNLVLGDLATACDEPSTVARRIERFGVAPRDPRLRARDLSGGNQQKLVMARAFDRDARALVLAQPTRGVDIGTARVIRGAIAELAAGGAGVLVVSADLAELRSLAHRIVVLRGGELVAEFPPTATDEELGRAMLGADAHAPVATAVAQA